MTAPKRAQRTFARKTKRVRRKLLLYPRFQLSLIALNALVMTVMMAIPTIQMRRSFLHFQELGEIAALPPNHDYFKFFRELQNVFFGNFVMALVIGILCSAVFSLIISNKVIGPILRLRNYFERISTQKGLPQDPLVFRKSDYFHDLAPTVNKALDRIKDDPTKWRDAA